MALPFNACIVCVQRPRCPIMTSGARGQILVPKPAECILRQLDEKNLAALCSQIENRLGLLEIDRENLGRQLEFVLEEAGRRERRVIN